MHRGQVAQLRPLAEGAKAGAQGGGGGALAALQAALAQRDVQLEDARRQLLAAEEAAAGAVPPAVEGDPSVHPKEGQGGHARRGGEAHTAAPGAEAAQLRALRAEVRTYLGAAG